MRSAARTTAPAGSRRSRCRCRRSATGDSDRARRAEFPAPVRPPSRCRASAPASRPRVATAAPRIPCGRECARPARRRGGGARAAQGARLRPRVSWRFAAAIMPVRSRPSTCAEQDPCVEFGESMDADLKRAVSARAVSTVCREIGHWYSRWRPEAGPRPPAPIVAAVSTTASIDGSRPVDPGAREDDGGRSFTPPRPGRRAARPGARWSAHRPVRPALRPRSPAAICRASG